VTNREAAPDLDVAATRRPEVHESDIENLIRPLTIGGSITVPESQLAQTGVTRESRLTWPYWQAVMICPDSATVDSVQVNTLTFRNRGLARQLD
jgi:hypothetical protein